MVASSGFGFVMKEDSEELNEPIQETKESFKLIVNNMKKDLMPDVVLGKRLYEATRDSKKENAQEVPSNSQNLISCLKDVLSIQEMMQITKIIKLLKQDSDP